MKWFRKTFVWASIGCVGATAPAFAQSTPWQPEAVRPAANGVSLGRPRPLALEPLRVVNAFDAVESTAPVGVKQASYVVRGVRPTSDEEPKSLSLPKNLPPLFEPPA